MYAKTHFDPSILTPEDRELAEGYLKAPHGITPYRLFDPDETIQTAGRDYLHRWYITPKDAHGLTYFHIQVADDDDRGLHDHPWDNMSVILAGGYEETLNKVPGIFGPQASSEDFSETFIREPGDVIFRQAHWAHRLALPAGVPYTMTLFSTGPRNREWGFWINGRWVDWQEANQ